MAPKSLPAPLCGTVGLFYLILVNSLVLVFDKGLFTILLNHLGTSSIKCAIENLKYVYDSIQPTVW